MVQLFCTVPSFLQAVPTRDCWNMSDSTVQLFLSEEDGRQDLSREIYPQIRDPRIRGVLHRLQELLKCFWQYSTAVFIWRFQNYRPVSGRNRDSRILSYRYNCTSRVGRSYSRTVF
jgi:hypothetical protein